MVFVIDVPKGKMTALLLNYKWFNFKQPTLNTSGQSVVNGLIQVFSKSKFALFKTLQLYLFMNTIC